MVLSYSSRLIARFRNVIKSYYAIFSFIEAISITGYTICKIILF